jgi:putative FmdB family regulatory protein
MPTYEYACGKCNETYERFQPMSAPTTDTCPECGGKAKRLISGGSGFLFKGSGFYITDYRSKDYAQKAKAESSAGTSTGTCGKESGKACTKPGCAAAADAKKS